MIAVAAQLAQDFSSSAELAGALRAATGTALRRPSALTQLAVAGALGCLPPERRELPTALFWQSASGAQAETERLLQEMRGDAEPMPYDFLATQPALAGATLRAWLPGLMAASHWPLPAAGRSAWGPLLALAIGALKRGRQRQALVAQLDCRNGEARGRWLLLATEVEIPLASVDLVSAGADASAGVSATVADTPALPDCLADWLAGGEVGTLRLLPPAGYRQTVEFGRPPTP